MSAAHGRGYAPTMARATTFLALLTLFGPGCSLSRGVTGGGQTDAGAHPSDAFVARGDTGIDAARPPIDMGVPPHDAAVPIDMGTVAVDLGVPPVDAGHDASLVDAGGCRGDLDCPMAVTTPGACTYASECATTAAATMQTTVSYTCVDRVCVMHTTTMPMDCTRTTDGTACGAAPMCTPCSATSCGASGTMTCTGNTCMAGACAPSATSTSCTTPNDMCGMLSGWGTCLPDAPFSSNCVQTRSWGQCIANICLPGGRSESRPCTCPHFP